MPRAQLGIGRLEAGAVVDDLEHQATVGHGQPHLDAVGGGVPEGILERLLGDPKHLASAIGVLRRGHLILDLELDIHVVEATEDVDVLSERTAEAVAIEVGRAQLEDQRAQLVERLAGELLEARHLRPRGVLVLVEEELLTDNVVELEREAVSLRERGQLAATLVEAGVGDRDRRVSREQLDQLLVRGVELLGALLLGQVEGSDHPFGGDDRNTEEGAHVRMPGRPPATEAGIGVDVGGAKRRRRLEHGAEHAVRPR
jgi:hypothetical protein